MGKYDFIKMKKKLSKYLDEARFEHTMGVMYTCAALAMVYDYDLEDAQAAGLLHDSAKCIPKTSFDLKVILPQHTYTMATNLLRTIINLYQIYHEPLMIR